ncbi:hypothetical protein HII31_00641 [Pseudocercospora fuligena]|uniref:Uncharacterized protein n=1 Tax=Pseudocercospora fuligena TaxID=685502 RepID=A0A8H6RV27_9PEZI|nr:hypothetical protein HII31_00641 [Pseudocercospora fuligena]
MSFRTFRPPTAPTMERKASKSKRAPSSDPTQTTSSTSRAYHLQGSTELAQANRQDIFKSKLFDPEWLPEQHVEPSQKEFAAFDNVLTDQHVNSTVTKPASESQFQAALQTTHAPTAMMQNQLFPEAPNPVHQSLPALALPKLYPQTPDDFYTYTAFPPFQTQLQSTYSVYQNIPFPQALTTGAHPKRSIESQVFIAAQQGLQLPFNTQPPFDAPVLFDAQVPIHTQALTDSQAPPGAELQFDPSFDPEWAFNPDIQYDHGLSFHPELPLTPEQVFSPSTLYPQPASWSASNSSSAALLSSPSPMTPLPSNLARPTQRSEPARRSTPNASAHSKKASRAKPNRPKRYPRHDRKGDDYEVEAYDQLTATEILNGGKGSITIRSHDIDGPAIMKEGFEPKSRTNGLNMITKRITNSLEDWTMKKGFMSTAEADEFEAAWRQLRLRTMATTGITGNALNPRNPKKMSANAKARQAKPKNSLAPAQ